MATLFIEELTGILSQTTSMSSEEEEEAKALIHKTYLNLKHAGLKQSGPCLRCKRIIIYDLSRPHRQYGDTWLDRLYARWESSKINVNIADTRHDPVLKVNGYSPKVTKCYLCSKCALAVDTEIMIAEKEFEERRDAQRAKQDRDSDLGISEIISGEKKSSPSKRFYTMVQFASIDPGVLQAMPYDEFLQTIYWDIIRGYKLYKAHYKCELCNQNGQLHVHHKTYENHGNEHEHLDDLIVLCRDCHAKFHNKLDHE